MRTAAQGGGAGDADGRGQRQAGAATEGAGRGRSRWRTGAQRRGRAAPGRRLGDRHGARGRCRRPRCARGRAADRLSDQRAAAHRAHRRARLHRRRPGVGGLRRRRRGRGTGRVARRRADRRRGRPGSCGGCVTLARGAGVSSCGPCARQRRRRRGHRPAENLVEGCAPPWASPPPDVLRGRRPLAQRHRRRAATRRCRAGGDHGAAGRRSTRSPSRACSPTSSRHVKSGDIAPATVAAAVLLPVAVLDAGRRRHSCTAGRAAAASSGPTPTPCASPATRRDCATPWPPWSRVPRRVRRRRWPTGPWHGRRAGCGRSPCPGPAGDPTRPGAGAAGELDAAWRCASPPSTSGERSRRERRRPGGRLPAMADAQQPTSTGSPASSRGRAPDRDVHGQAGPRRHAARRRDHGRGHRRARQDRRGRRCGGGHGPRARARRHPGPGRRGPDERPRADRGHPAGGDDPGDGQGPHRPFRRGAGPRGARRRLHRRERGAHARPTRRTTSTSGPSGSPSCAVPPTWARRCAGSPRARP